MTKVKIVTDSSCTMEAHWAKDLAITVVPLSVMVDGVIYADDDNFDKINFMSMMASSKSLPKTSQPPIGVFADLYEKLTADGSEVISIHMTEQLSGTVEAARQASNLVNGRITVVDSQFIDQSLSHQVIKAAQLAQAGASTAEILAAIKEVRQKSRLFIGISTLENLVKGGRISRTTGIVTSLLNIKIVMELQNGTLVPKAKGRGKKTFFKFVDELKSELQNQKIIAMGISYAGNAATALEIEAKLKALLPQVTIPVIHTNPIVATHAGDEAFAIMYYTA